MFHLHQTSPLPTAHCPLPTPALLGQSQSADPWPGTAGSLNPFLANIASSAPSLSLFFPFTSNPRAVGMDQLHLTHSLADAFNALADEVQILADRKTVLEHKLRFAHEQVSLAYAVWLHCSLLRPPSLWSYHHQEALLGSSNTPPACIAQAALTFPFTRPAGLHLSLNQHDEISLALDQEQLATACLPRLTPFDSDIFFLDVISLFPSTTRSLTASL